MGDDILNSTLSLAMLNMTDEDFKVLGKRFDLITREHQYKRLSLEVRLVWRYGHKYIEFHYRLPDSSGDPDGMHVGNLEIFHERVVGIMRSLYGPEHQLWDLSTEHRLP